jgi:predicted membrane-bound spermidine synthase
VNTASQDLPRHLGVLQEKLQHATDYDQALYYFLEEFSGDAAFMQQCEPDESLHLIAALKHVVGKTMGKEMPLQNSRVFRLAQFRFSHGNAAVGERVVLFFYFDAVDTGLMALIPGLQGEAEVARFRLTGGLSNPKHN